MDIITCVGIRLMLRELSISLVNFRNRVPMQASKANTFCITDASLILLFSRFSKFVEIKECLRLSRL